MKPQHILFGPAHHCLMAAAVSLALAGCAHMNPDHGPEAALAAPERVALAPELVPSGTQWPTEQWWRSFGDSQLDQLMTQALRDAPTMALAKARIEASAAQAQLAHADGGLQVGLTAEINRQSVSENGFLAPFAATVPSIGASGPRYTEGTVGLQAHYEFDMWGKERSRVDAALGVRNARQAEAAQAELMLSAQLARLYFDLQALHATRALLAQAHQVEDTELAAHQARAARGVEAATSTELARARILESERQLSVADGRIANLREAIRALAGAGPNDLVAIAPAALPSATVKAPATLGYTLLARRPDLQAMRWYVQASLSQVDVAKAAFYPSFDIKAFVGLDALHLNDLLNHGSRQINLIPGLSLPIFDSGRLNASLSGARAQHRVVMAEYNQAILDAVRQVAQGSIELASLDRQSQLQQARIQAIELTAASARQHYAQGLADTLQVGDSRLQVLAEQVKLVEVKRQQLAGAVALTAALGGGYDSEGAAAVAMANHGETH